VGAEAFQASLPDGPGRPSGSFCSGSRGYLKYIPLMIVVVGDHVKDEDALHPDFGKVIPLSIGEP